ncbi:MAG: hypothetical protein WBX15_18975 [Thermoanaerobaculia bacterium]
MKRKYGLIAIVVLAASLLVGGAFAQSMGHMMNRTPDDQGKANSGQPGWSYQQMVQAHEAMQKKLDAMDTRLDKMVAEMDHAKGAAKIDRMAAVIDELVHQRQTLRKEWTSMMGGQNGMMGYGSMGPGMMGDGMMGNGMMGNGYGMHGAHMQGRTGNGTAQNQRYANGSWCWGESQPQSGSSH